MNIVITSEMRVGSRWLHYLLADILDMDVSPEREIKGHRNEIKKYFNKNKIVKLHHEPPFFHNKLNGNYKVIGIVRNPRDRIVSRAFHIRVKDKRKFSSNGKFTDIKKADTDTQAVKLAVNNKHIRKYTRDMFQYMKPNKSTRSHRKGRYIWTTYEWMLDDTLGEIKAILEFLGVDKSDKFLKKKIRKHSFKKKAGRKRGKEDRSDGWRRKGVKGDWQNWFDDEMEKKTQYFVDKYIGKLPNLSVEDRKDKIVNQYGTKPTIAYYYYTYQVIDYAGEETVRKSFESLAGQGQEVIVTDYGFDQKTKDLAEECGLTYIWCEKDDGVTFNESKVRNNVIQYSDANFLVDWNVHVEAPPNLNRKLKRWIRNNDITKESPHIRYLWIGDPKQYDNPKKIRKIKKKARKYHSFALLAYRPFLVDMGGYDERTYFCGGSQKFGVKLLKDVYNIKQIDLLFDVVHKYHQGYKLPRRNKCKSELPKKPKKIINKVRAAMQKDIDKGKKLIHNSFW